MKKVAFLFVLAVFVPSLILAWLALRSLRDQQFLLERQRSLLYQGVTDGLAKDVVNAIGEQQHALASKVVSLLRERTRLELARSFDEVLRQEWPLTQVGFVVTRSGEILSPSPVGRTEARLFYTDNGRFLANRESAEVYLNPKQSFSNLANNQIQTPPQQVEMKGYQARNVTPQQGLGGAQKAAAAEDLQQRASKVTASEAEFRQLIGEENEGTIARFVDNKLNLLFWYRSPPPPAFEGANAIKSSQTPVEQELVFGAQLSLPRFVETLRPLLQPGEPSLGSDVCVALLDDSARPVALSHPGFIARWKHPFVATEIGEALPHWEIALYLLDPTKLTQSARTLELTLGLLIGVLVLAIAVGSWLIVADLNRQLVLARQKTDFVSNVSHELKTPLTSIRMFSELLAEGRVTDPDKQRSYLAIITADAARLTRLINNVLDFARMERGEKKYHFEPCDIVRLARETTESFRPHLEANGFRLVCDLPGTPVLVSADRDALAQVLVNLLSNAEKYSDDRKEIIVELEQLAAPLPHVEVRILDRGIGVPAGSEEKIFEKFYRANDSLSNGVQGSGLGLTLARQIARAHGGEIAYEPRAEGGSRFSLRLPLKPDLLQSRRPNACP